MRFDAAGGDHGPRTGHWRRCRFTRAFGQMLLRGGPDACTARRPSRRPRPPEGRRHRHRAAAFGPVATARRATPRAPALDRIDAEAQRLRRLAGPPADHSPGALAALAYPDRVALRRPGGEPRYLLSGRARARGCRKGTGWPRARLLVVADTDGAQPEATIRLAAAISEAEVRALFAGAIETVETAEWSARDGRVVRAAARSASAP